MSDFSFLIPFLSFKLKHILHWIFFFTLLTPARILVQIALWIQRARFNICLNLVNKLHPKFSVSSNQGQQAQL